ncbi:MAG: hypothetical protein ABSB25_00370 [Sedimentisphaerales bacterium]|jgi:uncharacterized protein (DUF1778 family)
MLFQMRLSAEEQKTIGDAAKASGLNSSSWARMTLLKEAKCGDTNKAVKVS